MSWIKKIFGIKPKKQCAIHNVVGNEVKFESGLTCMMCRQPKENDGHTCCEDCAGLAF